MASATVFPIYSIGHSNHPLGFFIGLLKAHRIGMVADVRSSPYSGRNPQFNRECLKESLRPVGVSYSFCGEALGARSDNPKCYVDGQVQYSRIAEQGSFKDALNRLLDMSRDVRVALMCAEKDPLDCHRTILVAEEFARQGHEILHILPGGEVETHRETLQRLMAKLNVSEPDLFASETERMEDALRVQESRIAYRADDGAMFAMKERR